MRIIIQKYGLLIFSILLFASVLISSSFVVFGKSSENRQGITTDGQLAQKDENSESVDSVPKRTILALICVGLIGFLCIPRNKNGKENFNGRNNLIKDKGDAG